MMLLLESAIKISLLVGVALLVAMLLRRRSAALRHWVLATAVLLAFATPLLIVMAPSWTLPRAAVPLQHDSETRAAVTVETPNTTGSTTTPAIHTSAPPRPPIDVVPFLVGVWLAGAALHLSGLLFGFWRLHRIAARAVIVRDGPWAEEARSLCEQFDIRGPVTLLRSTEPALLMTWGFFTPRITLPADAESFTVDRIRVVLAHELAHVRRGDWIVQITSELLRATYWFNPLLWLACARLRLESEHACDDAVVNLGVPGGDYASHLLEIARHFGAPRQRPLPAVAILPRPSSLERRVSAMLNPGLSRRPVSRYARFGTIVAMLAVGLPIALFAQNRFSTITGSVTDPSGGLLPGVKVVANDTTRGARHEVVTNRSGQFELIGLAEGPHVLQVSLPGFQTFEQKLTLDGQDLNRNIQLRVGTLQETISVTRGGAPPSFEGVRYSPKQAECGASPPAGGGRNGGTPLRIGGQIRQPAKVRHVSPIYPEGSSPGIVRMEAVIGPNGFVQETKILNGAAPALAQAADDAVRQWEFTPTLLNCVAIPVIMTVTVDFN